MEQSPALWHGEQHHRVVLGSMGCFQSQAGTVEWPFQGAKHYAAVKVVGTVASSTHLQVCAAHGKQTAPEIHWKGSVIYECNLPPGVVCL